MLKVDRKTELSRIGPRLDFFRGDVWIFYLPDFTSHFCASSRRREKSLEACDHDKPSLVRRAKEPLSTTDPTGTIVDILQFGYFLV